ncbi:MAG: Hsp20/alpha crystallin family protein [Syntrophobacteraceae bacterium]
MAIINYPARLSGRNPWQEIIKMKSDMERLFSGVTASGVTRYSDPTSGVFPALNVLEDGDKILIEAELPGIKPEDLDISVMGNTVTLMGERKPDGAESAGYHRKERQSGKFHKALTLPYEIDPEKVEAHCQDGVLSLTLPKAEHAKPIKIQIAGK